MICKVKTDGFAFEFRGESVNAYIFDDYKQHKLHNQMKAVDIVAEFSDEYLFIELKRFDSNRGIDFRCPLWNETKTIKSCPLSSNDTQKAIASIKRVSRELKQKYFDTMLYRLAEGIKFKSTNYICVIEGCDSGIISRMRDVVYSSMPSKIPLNKEGTPLVKNVAVVNVSQWNSIPQISKYGTCELI